MRGGVGETPCDRVVMHVDMDAFYAQVEQMHRPELRGKPIIVGLGAPKRGVVATCSYEAREYGVKSGMSAVEALRLCPPAILVQGSMDSYVHYAELIRGIFREFTPCVEPTSIDEAFLDVTASLKIFPDPVDIAKSLKKEVLNRLGLTCSVGMSVNKHIAKIASALEKPDGLTAIWPHEFDEKFFPLDVGKIYGVGPVTRRTLNEVGIFTVGDLANADRRSLSKRLGVNAAHLIKVAKGLDDSPVHAHEDQADEKSISHESTFDRDSRDLSFMHSVILHLTDKVRSRMRKGCFYARTVTLRVRFADFETISRAHSLEEVTDDVSLIYETARSLLPVEKALRKGVRLLGVRASNLSKTNHTEQISLFDDRASAKKHDVQEAVELVRKRFGKKSIVRAGSLKFLSGSPARKSEDGR